MTERPITHLLQDLAALGYTPVPVPGVPTLAERTQPWPLPIPTALDVEWKRRWQEIVDHSVVLGVTQPIEQQAAIDQIVDHAHATRTPAERAADDQLAAELRHRARENADPTTPDG